MSAILIGIDTGGTFTDVVLCDLSSNYYTYFKLPTSTGKPSQAVLDGIKGILELSNLPSNRVEFLVLGTTLGTNAVLEGKCSNTGMITTLLTGFNLDNHKVIGNGTTRTVRIVAPTSNQPLSPSSIVYSLDPSTAGSIGGTTLTLTAPCRIYATQAPAPDYTGGNASIGLNWTLTTDSEVISSP